MASYTLSTIKSTMASYTLSTIKSTMASYLPMYARIELWWTSEYTFITLFEAVANSRIENSSHYYYRRFES